MKRTLNLLIALFIVTGMGLVSCGGGADHSDGADEATEQTEGMDDAAGEEAEESHEGHDHDGEGHDHDAEDMDGDTTNMGADGGDQTGPEYTSAYVCPMHCDGSGSAEAGDCPVCGMKLRENPDATESAEM